MFLGIATKQTYRRFFIPIRPRIRTDSTADLAHHAPDFSAPVTAPL
jgi:hypothetical protein